MNAVEYRVLRIRPIAYLSKDRVYRVIRVEYNDDGTVAGYTDGAAGPESTSPHLLQLTVQQMLEAFTRPIVEEVNLGLVEVRDE